LTLLTAIQLTSDSPPGCQLTTDPSHGHSADQWLASWSSAYQWPASRLSSTSLTRLTAISHRWPHQDLYFSAKFSSCLE
jgi:hypothetical protein